MKDEEFIKYLEEHNIWKDLLVYIRDNDTQEINNELLLFGGIPGDWEWVNDWYEGQDYTIVGYIPISEIPQNVGGITL